MTQTDALFAVLILIALSSLALVVVQLVRSRRRGPGDAGPRNWWEGPWDEDER